MDGCGGPAAPVSTPRKREAPSSIADAFAETPAKPDGKSAAKREHVAAARAASPAALPAAAPIKQEQHDAAPPSPSQCFTCVLLYADAHECVAACGPAELRDTLSHAGFAFAWHPTPRWVLPRAADDALLAALTEEAKAAGVLLRVMRHPAPRGDAPLCAKHHVRCVLRTAGQDLRTSTAKPENYGRRFWTCPEASLASAQQPRDDERCTWRWEDGGYSYYDDQSRGVECSYDNYSDDNVGCDCGAPDFYYYSEPNVDLDGSPL